MVQWVVGTILHGVDPLSYFSFQPVLYEWCNKDRGMYYPVCGMMHIKEPLLLIGKSSQCGGSGFPLSLSEWSSTMCPTPYNRNKNVLSASLNKIFPPFPLKYFSFQPVLHDRFNRPLLGMRHSDCGTVHVNNPLLLLGKCSNRSSGSGFSLSLSSL